jgi:hypothetical protein
LERQRAQQVIGVGVVWMLDKDLPIERLGLLKLAGSMMSQGGLKSLSDLVRRHRLAH